MILRIGSYQIADNAARVTTRVEPVFSPGTGIPIRNRRIMDVLAYLDVSGASDASVKEQAIRDALATAYGTDALFLDNAGNPTAGSIKSAQSLTGAWVSAGPNFTESTDGEHVTIRTVQFQITAEYLIPNRANVLYYRETLQGIGNGGPLRRWRFPVNLRVGIRQQITPVSLVRVIQSGQAIGHISKPTPPKPYFPDYLVNESGSTSEGTQRRIGRAQVEYPISWSYVYEADSPSRFALSIPSSLPPLP